MITRFVEACHAGERGNWGKFLLMRFDTEWEYRSALPAANGASLLKGRGWDRQHLWVLDLQTGEGAFFRPGGYAPSDLKKHAIWVCPLFEPFLTWLWKHREYHDDITKVPALVEFDPKDAAFDFQGYRRPGPR